MLVFVIKLLIFWAAFLNINLSNYYVAVLLSGLMYRCIRCPTAYHANDLCIAAGTVLIAGYNIICNSHLLTSKSPKRAVLHVNATWCFTCSKGKFLQKLCTETIFRLEKFGTFMNLWEFIYTGEQEVDKRIWDSTM